MGYDWCQTIHYDKRGRPMKIACIPLGIFAFCLAVLTICRAASARSLHDASIAEATVPVVQGGWSRHDSQLGADRWVLERLAGSRYYVDVGANQGQLISNTYLLDKLGWRGLCIEPVETAGYEERTCIMERQVVGNQVDQQVEFVVGDDSSLSGNNAFLGVHAETVGKAGKTVVRNSTTLQTILEKHKFPAYIDFMSLDTEGSEFEILKATDLEKYIFGHIAVEHNLEEPKRTQIRKLLLAHGYVLDKEVDVDDWYVRKGCSAAVTDWGQSSE